MDTRPALTYLLLNLFLTTLLAPVIFILIKGLASLDHGSGFLVIFSLFMAIPIGLLFIPFGLLILKSELDQTKKRISTYIFGAALIFLLPSILIGLLDSMTLDAFRAVLLFDSPYFLVFGITAAFLPLPYDGY